MKDKLRSQNSDHDQENTTNQVKNAHFNKNLNIQNCDNIMMLGEPALFFNKKNEEGWVGGYIVSKLSLG